MGPVRCWLIFFRCPLQTSRAADDIGVPDALPSPTARMRMWIVFVWNPPPPVFILHRMRRTGRTRRRSRSLQATALCLSFIKTAGSEVASMCAYCYARAKEKIQKNIR
ncbi:uncharacterized protein LY79DRAFT_54065 [Colletotrichum navitas]|uniref:Secreted protein n=1 Tax=Colletotrichum navitas TaxID=681940 RepID=A0AAD8PLT7_9PEZI|nr:uncharacterized protein LY79DRAFT_54065 [Colletotrichum navitas]KAK1570104.1 hypothetical protein LY79DRAFT_54065 [Colletotrichum navitas]